MLAVVLKYWAKVILMFPCPTKLLSWNVLYQQLCQLDIQELGSYPSQMFVLMLIHFLQQRFPPVLPVPPKVGVAGIFKYSITYSIGFTAKRFQ